MIDRIVSSLHRGFVFLGAHRQLLLTTALLVIIPIAFLSSGQQFLSVSQENQGRLEKDRIGIMHDIFLEVVRDNLENPAALQKHIVDVVENNPDLVAFRVVRPKDAQFIPIASLDESRIGIPEEDDAPYRLAAVRIDDSILAEVFIDGDRHWQGYRAVTNDAGDITAFIYTNMSRAAVDALFIERVRNAYWYLVIIIIVILVLLVRQVRLIDYSHLYRELQGVSDMKDDFINMAAHELRTPLTAIRGYASLIREAEGIPDRTRSNAGKIEEASEQLVVLVNDLLDLARIQSGKLKIEPERSEISEVLSAVVDSLNPIAGQKGVTLTFEQPKNPIYLKVDVNRIRQVFTNMISNAIKYTPKGSVTIAASKTNGHVEIRVKDTGMGISAEDQKQLFSQFFRVDNEKTAKITGTGLGMWIAKQLVEEMGGTVGVESIKNVGTHVVITFPEIES